MSFVIVLAFVGGKIYSFFQTKWDQSWRAIDSQSIFRN